MLMFKLQWKINGLNVPAHRIADELGKAVRAVTARIARVRSPVHGSAPRNIRSGARTGSDRVHFQYEVCWDSLRQAISQTLR